jgi:hypothetical protein
MGDAQALAFGRAFRAADKSMHSQGQLALPDGQPEGAAQKAGANYGDLFEVHSALKSKVAGGKSENCAARKKGGSWAGFFPSLNRTALSRHFPFPLAPSKP